LARGGSATRAWRNSSAIGLVASVRTSQSLSRCRMRTCCRRSRSRRSVFHSGTIPASRDKSSRHFCIVSARNEQNTCPRMAASEEWKIGRVRITALVRKNRFSTWSKSRYRRTACSGVIFALVRNTKMPSKRASSASLPASSRRRADPWCRGSCADSAGRRSCRPEPCHPFLIAHRAPQQSLHGHYGPSRPPPHCGRQCNGCPRSSPV
jgi:hypothetical protein